MTTLEIALVDDDLSARRGLTRLLRSGGFTVRAFASGQEVLDAELGPAVRCLVADIHLGLGINGFDLVERLRATGVALPVIFITAHDEPVSRDRADQLGARAYLSKPFESATFLDAVHAAVAACPH